jgi:hypothetical protein
LDRWKGKKRDYRDLLDSLAKLEKDVKVTKLTTEELPILRQITAKTRDRHSREESRAIRLASQKYYDNVVAQYFDRVNRFALEPLERKLDRNNQRQLLKALIAEAREVRRRIQTNEIGGTYFAHLGNPPVSHFAVSPRLEKVLSALELNFLLTKYHDMRDKDGNDVSVYAFFHGLCEAERFPWGYPRTRRDDRSYFVQRCFNYNSTVHQFLSKSQTIRCPECGACFPTDQRDSFELYK